MTSFLTFCWLRPCSSGQCNFYPWSKFYTTGVIFCLRRDKLAAYEMSADNGSRPKDSAVILRSNDVGWKSLSGVVGGRERVAYGGKGLGGHPTQRLPTNII